MHEQIQIFLRIADSARPCVYSVSSNFPEGFAWIPHPVIFGHCPRLIYCCHRTGLPLQNQAEHACESKTGFLPVKIAQQES